MALITSEEQWINEANDLLNHHDHDAVSKRASPCSSSSMKLMTSSSRTRTDASNCKPVIAKRRSRASRKTPVTRLNADASNFMALVQQFTGCPTTPLSLGVPFKGPITLNFRRGTREMQIHHNDRSNATIRPSSSKDDQVLHVSFHDQNYQQHHQFPQQQQIESSQQVSDLSDFDDDGLHLEQPMMMMMEKTGNTGDIITVDPSGDSSSGASSSSSIGLEFSHHHNLTDDGFDGLMDDFSLHDLIAMNNAFSNDLGYFV